MLFSLLYEMVLGTLALLYLPKLIFQRLVYGKYQTSFWKRLGFDFPQINKGERPLVWIHAVSVGETKAISALARQLKSRLNNPLIIISSITETGHAEAKRSMPFADHFVYLPIDLYWVIAPIVKRVRPDLVLLCETDIWYHFLNNCKMLGASIAVVNGKISERSQNRLLAVAPIARYLFKAIDLFCVQNQVYQQRFESMGVSPDKLVVTGNMKFDEFYPKLSSSELSTWREQLGIKDGDQVLVAGSTHDPEEKIIMEAMQEVWQFYPNVKVLLVPRHPERFPEVADILSKMNVPYMRFSDPSKKTGKEKVILIDAMGVLRKCYQLADLAFVGGSFTSRVGGHNIIEPCGYGVPVLFGPHMYSQPELLQLVTLYGAGQQVLDTELAETIKMLLQDRAKRALLGQGGERLMSEMQGATDRTWQAIKALPHVATHCK